LVDAHVWHHDALQKVMRERLSAALRSKSVCRSLGWRTESKMRFVWERFEGLRREKARFAGVGLKRHLAEEPTAEGSRVIVLCLFVYGGRASFGAGDQRY
jgi:hypothetical protein